MTNRDPRKSRSLDQRLRWLDRHLATMLVEDPRPTGFRLACVMELINERCTLLARRDATLAPIPPDPVLARLAAEADKLGLNPQSRPNQPRDQRHRPLWGERPHMGLFDRLAREQD